ncbi:MAG: DUF721 domain-containing protein [Candidatus Cloacimonetes bacterium]|nr:DUF721 domain-containing protein [Candidatus Cloacimonadota bacterium]
MPWVEVGSFCRELILKIAGDKYRLLTLICLNWKDIVGSLLAEHSNPKKYEHHILFVKVSNPTWMQELILIKSIIIERLNSKLDMQINDIIFITGSKRGRK